MHGLNISVEFFKQKLFSYDIFVKKMLVMIKCWYTKLFA